MHKANEMRYMSRPGCASTVMYPPTQCKDQNIIQKRAQNRWCPR